ncbi:PilZ domain-containing protein [Desulfovibrio sp. OttesenSCG-928-A18]|nr:PilZ domain-containing protein [Desulfovibrio sp. OttesenSCG-928-A18]
MATDSSADTGQRQERRAHLRVPLDVPVLVTARLDDEHNMIAMLVDCGRGGVQLAFSPATRALPDILGRRIAVLGLPPALQPMQRHFTGMITWVSHERCGVRFEKPLPLNEDELVRITRSL